MLSRRLSSSSDGGVSGPGAIRAAGFEGFEHVLDADAEMFRELGRRGRSPAFAGQEVDGLAEIDMEILDRAVAP